MRLTERGKQELLDGGRQLGLNLEPHIPQFAQLFDLLTTANQTTNLTAIRDELGIVQKHFIDSLTCLHSDRLNPNPKAKIIDVGTGAGFPGLPLAIVRPQLQIDLLDATRKKIEFIAQAIQQLGLPNAKATWGRAETLGHQPEYRESYDGAVTRAVSSVGVVAELCLPLVKAGGFVLIQRGIEVDQELQQAAKWVKELGGTLTPLLQLRLPNSGEQRTLVMIEKISPTPQKYPRKVGVPAKNPLF